MRSALAASPIVPICAHAAPPANAPDTSSSKITEVTTSGVGSMVMTTPASRTASAGVAATSAPASASGAVAEADRSHTVVRSPARSRLRAIAEPMMPVPSTAVRVPSPRSSVALIQVTPPGG